MIKNNNDKFQLVQEQYINSQKILNQNERNILMRHKATMDLIKFSQIKQSAHIFTNLALCFDRIFTFRSLC